MNNVALTHSISIRNNDGGKGTKIIYSSGSSVGDDRYTNAVDFGVTIYESLPTGLTLHKEDFTDYESLAIITPPGRRDYTFSISSEVHEIIPLMKAGHEIVFITQNYGGLLSFTNQASPAMFTLNGRAYDTVRVDKLASYTAVSRVDGSLDYVAPLPSRKPPRSFDIIYKSPRQQFNKYGKTIYRNPFISAWTDGSNPIQNDRAVDEVIIESSLIKFKDANNIYTCNGGYAKDSPYFYVKNSTKTCHLRVPTGFTIISGHVDFTK